MKLKLQNSIITFLGNYIFEIYLLQRLVMISLDNKIGNLYSYFLLSFAITVLLAILFKQITQKVDYLLFHRSGFIT